MFYDEVGAYRCGGVDLGRYRDDDREVCPGLFRWEDGGGFRLIVRGN